MTAEDIRSATLEDDHIGAIIDLCATWMLSARSEAIKNYCHNGPPEMK